MKKKKKINQIDDYFDRLRETFPLYIANQHAEIAHLQYKCLQNSKQ